jgi:hypothetical protein
MFSLETIHFLIVTGHDGKIDLEGRPVNERLMWIGNFSVNDVDRSSFSELSGDDRERTSHNDTSITSEQGTNCEGAAMDEKCVSSE